MGQALYRKYRSKSLDEIIGQEHITTTLKQALASGRISHAYLFTGPRGTGKTSIARILAHEINQLPYTDDSSHMDIIEIDAASNRRIDEIRELREKVYVAPTSAKYKVYIIDEVHMLTKEAFNALLKTLEEPPAHVVFILATTDAHKLPDTIVSRTQRFSFKPVEAAKVIAHLKTIAKQEKLKVSDEALKLLADHGEGSFRDSISLLDQASSDGNAVEADEIRDLLGIPPAAAIDELLDAVQAGDALAPVVQALSTLVGRGYQPAAIAQQLGQCLRQQLVSGISPIAADDTLALLADLLAVPAAHDPERYLEIVLLRPLSGSVVVKPAVAANKAELRPKAAVVAELMETTEPSKPVATAKPVEKITPLQPDDAISSPTDDAQPEVKLAEVEQPSKPVKSTKLSLNQTIWPDILGALKQNHNTLYGVIRMAQPNFKTGELELAFAFAFHQKRISETRNQQLLSDIIHNLTGQTVRITCIVDKSATPPQTTPAKTKVTPPPAEEGNLATISNIFGGGELLES